MGVLFVVSWTAYILPLSYVSTSYIYTSWHPTVCSMMFHCRSHSILCYTISSNVSWRFIIIPIIYRYVLATPKLKPRFTMLKSWMTNPDLSSIDVEEKYVSYVEQLRTDRYTTVTWIFLKNIDPGMMKCVLVMLLLWTLMMFFRSRSCNWRKFMVAQRVPRSSLPRSPRAI